MSGDDPEAEQLRFEAGDLVKPQSEDASEPDKDQPDPVSPNEGVGFTVAVKDGALAVNTNVIDAVEIHGRTLEFGSRTAAERYAAQLSSGAGSLRVQGAAPNDPSDADAYLLADHNPSIKEPADIDGETWTFDVGANLYGSLGEAILLHSPKPHALYYFVREDLDLETEELEHELQLTVRQNQYVPPEEQAGDELGGWRPDCKLVARDGWSGQVLETYYCEIKTGNASFERSQVATMEQLAEDERVLKIRLLIDELPDQYSLRIHEVAPSN